MTRPRITLAAWLAANFAEGNRPTLNTARAWRKAGKIYPPPVKCGRAYYLDPAARYTDDPDAKPRLLDRIRHDEATPQPGEPVAAG